MGILLIVVGLTVTLLALVVALGAATDLDGTGDSAAPYVLVALLGAVGAYLGRLMVRHVDTDPGADPHAWPPDPE